MNKLIIAAALAIFQGCGEKDAPVVTTGVAMRAAMLEDKVDAAEADKIVAAYEAGKQAVKEEAIAAALEVKPLQDILPKFNVAGFLSIQADESQIAKAAYANYIAGLVSATVPADKKEAAKDAITNIRLALAKVLGMEGESSLSLEEAVAAVNAVIAPKPKSASPQREASQGDAQVIASPIASVRGSPRRSGDAVMLGSAGPRIVSGEPVAVRAAPSLHASASRH